MFIADILGAAMNRLLVECQSSINHTAGFNRILPEPIMTSSGPEYSCKHDIPHLLNIRPSDGLENNSSWSEFADFHGVPGFIINNDSDPSLRSKNFSFAMPLVTNFTTYIGLLRITFLKTYYNAGIVTLSICGINISNVELDAFYSSPKIRVSMPHVFLYFLTLEQNAACQNIKQNEDRSLIVHFKTTNSSMERRFQQKFKLLRVELCSSTWMAQLGDQKAKYNVDRLEDFAIQ